MLRVNIRGSTEAAFGFIAAGVAQMSGLICHSTTIFACISHIYLLMAVVYVSRLGGLMLISLNMGIKR